MDRQSIIIMLVFIAFCIGSYWLGNAIGAETFNRWAVSRRYVILSKRRRLLFAGPWFGQGRTVYYVTVQLPDGRQRNGYARLCWFNRVDMHWVFDDKIT